MTTKQTIEIKQCLTRIEDLIQDDKPVVVITSKQLTAKDLLHLLEQTLVHHKPPKNYVT